MLVYLGDLPEGKGRERRQESAKHQEQLVSKPTDDLWMALHLSKLSLPGHLLMTRKLLTELLAPAPSSLSSMGLTCSDA